MADSSLHTRRTWLPAEARRRLSVHGKVTNVDALMSRSSPAVAGGAQFGESGVRTSAKDLAIQSSAAQGKSSELISPKTPFACGHEFSETTASGHSPGVVSPAASQEVNSKPSLLPRRCPAPFELQEALGKH